MSRAVMHAGGGEYGALSKYPPCSRGNHARPALVALHLDSGKVVLQCRLQQVMEGGKITVSRSQATGKHSIKLATLIAALFVDEAQGSRTHFRIHQ
ncbi:MULTISPECIES: hypothetical protein [unclassified Pseudomonas]|uniref:hypothetical protein n=1 Tax=unclassified Pseudomonas TaxID=196821 RepID=UPI00117A2423|nr:MULTISPECIES: hypothetical protein [unclassified Pseudomonas]